LQGMPLENLHWVVNAERDGPILRSIKTLNTINYRPAAEVLKEVDRK
jgi:hypothetical protein